MKKILHIITIAITTIIISGVSALPTGAVNLFQGCSNVDSVVCKQSSEGQSDKGASMIQYVVNTILYLLGIIAVIVIIVGGFTYATSGGDSSKIAQGKNTILYAVIGLVIGIFSFAIVNLVIFRLQGASTGNNSSSQNSNNAAAGNNNSASNQKGGITP